MAKLDISGPLLRIDAITIFPEYLEPLGLALLGRAQSRGIIDVAVHNLRAWSTGVHQAVDDSPFGGGPGMVMVPTVWKAALDEVCSSAAGGNDVANSGTPTSEHVSRKRRPLLIVPTPAGKTFTQADAHAFAGREHIVFACGRYEGIDQRVIDDAARTMDVVELSIGDYVLIGGEVAVLAICEAVVRLLPGVLGNAQSHQEDSFSDGLLEGPSYTRPEIWEGHQVPEPLRSGNHARIAKWRREQSVLRTAERRPELFANAEITPSDIVFLREHGFGDLADSLAH